MTAEHRRVLVDEVGLEPVTARLVEQHAAGAAPQHDRQLAARRGPGAQHRERALGRGAGDVFRVDLVEDLEPERAPGRLGAGLHPGVADGHAVDAEAGADAVVLDEQAVGVGDEHPAAGVGVARR